MAGRSLFILLLGFLLHLTFVKTETCSQQPFSRPNDNRVTLTYETSVDLTQITLEENADGIIAVYNCDNPEQMKLQPFIDGSNSDLNLTISGDGSLVVGTKQDYEVSSNRLYTFKITLSSSKQTTVTLSITNVDDNTPTIAPYGSSSCLVDEGLGMDEPTKCYLLVTDADGIGIPDGMTFQVLDKDTVSDAFTLQSSSESLCDSSSTNCMTVELYLHKKLSYYDDPVYSLKTEVMDPAGHIGNLSFVVQVNAENLESPVITPDSYDVLIDENYSGVLDIPDLLVVDSDSLEYGQFDIKLESDNECVQAFSVFPSVGYRNADLKISVIDPSFLDFEKKECQIIVSTLKATEVADKSHIGTSTITVTLKDLNDESPIFTQSSYEMTVKEHEEMDHIIGLVTATDADAGDKVTYDLTGSEQLKINPDTGEISVNDTGIDYERLKKIFLTISAEDEATPNHHSAYATVIVTVTDINDEPPEIQMPQEQPQVDEDTNVGTEMDKIIITATDPDTNPDLSFDIDWTQSRAVKNGATQEDLDIQGCFSCSTTKTDAKHWKLSLRLEKELNWTAYDTLYLSITVEDKNTVPDFKNNSKSSATLTMKIIDVNNNAPVFSSDNELVLSFKENTEQGQLLGSIVAKDEDGPGNNDIQYSIVILDTDTDKEYVTIHEKNGVIRTGKDIVDYEEIQTLTCTITASDGKFDTPINITVNIEDVNDNAPNITDGFQEPIYVEENTNIYVDLRHILAHDDDLSSDFNTLRYQFQVESPFEINQTGGVYLPDGVGEKLDYELIQSYTVQLIVKDRCSSDTTCYYDTKSDTKPLIFQLVDVNDHAPIFNDVKDPFAEVDENIRKGDTIGAVSATDADTGEMGKITFILLDVISEQNKSVNIFDIKDNGDNKSATIFASNEFTEAWGTYIVTVNASDCAEPFHKTTQDFKIVVDDVNNHAPNFSFPVDGTIIRLDKTGSDTSNPLLDWNTNNTIQIKAFDDKDTGDFGSSGIVYNVVGDVIAKDYLTIDSSGYLRLKQKFGDDLTNRFTLSSEACDAKGDDELKNCTTQDADVILKITEQFEPTFDINVFETNFTENSTGLSEERVITVPVTDLNNVDEDCNVDCRKDDIYYFIIKNSEDKFTLIHNKTLVLQSILDREAEDVHTIIICVTNFHDGPKGEPDEKSKLYVTINVTDVIDTAPVFTKTLYSGGINIEDVIGAPLIQFNATDEDLDDHSSYSIDENSFNATDSSITSLANINSFSLDKDTGDLTLNFSPQKTMKGIFNFAVHVTDTGGFSAVTSAQVYMITDDNIMTFVFNNNVSYTEDRRRVIEDILTKVLKNEGIVKNLVTSSDTNGVAIDDSTDATIYFVNSELQVPVAKSEITKQLNNGQTLKTLKQAFLDQNLIFDSQVSNQATSSTDDGVPQTVLIVVSAVLGTLVLVLFAAFFLRTRSLNRRLEALSTTKFGSQDSGLNRVGVAVPNTNRHAVEGSNPVWGNEDVGSRDFDNMSETSGDSDLIGIEENPEFSPYSKSGTSNGGFTPGIEEGRRISVNPMIAAGFDRGAGLNPLSADAIEDFSEGSNMRRESVNPLAVSHDNLKNDTMGVDNFSFVPRPPITDL